MNREVHVPFCEKLAGKFRRFTHHGLHYTLDVGMNEDRCLIYRGYADRNLSIMRKIVLKLLNDDKWSSGGIALKRMKAALSTQYLKKVVGF